MIFDGTNIKVQDDNSCTIVLTLPDGQQETYTSSGPRMVIGNLMIPSRRYMEATGTATLTCSNGHSASFNFPVRGWTSNYYTNRVEVTTLDASETERFKIEGYYTTEL